MAACRLLLLHRRRLRPAALARVRTLGTTAQPGASMDACQDIYREMGALTTSFHDSQKQLASVKYTARINPLSKRIHDRASAVHAQMERIHDQFQMMLQRQGHKGITQAEIVFNGYRQLFTPGSWHYNILMDSFLRYSPAQCGSMLTRMEKDGIVPDIDFFNIWLRALAKMRSSVVDMQKVLDEMSRRTLQPDRFTHSTMLEILADNREVNLVNLTLNGMVSEGVAPTPAALSRILTLYGDTKDFTKGDAIRDSLIAAKETSYSLAIYSSIMRYTIMRRHLDIAERLWDEMDSRQTRPAPDVFDSYVGVVLDDDDLAWPDKQARLHRVLHRAAAGFVRLTLGPMLSSLPQLVQEYSKDIAVLTVFFEAVVQSTFPAKLAVQESFAEWVREHGDIGTLKVVVDTMDKVGLSAQSLGHAIVHKCVDRNPSLCQELVGFMVDRGIPVYRESLASIVFAGANRSDLDSCDRIRGIMQQLGMAPTEGSLNAHLNTAIHSNCSARVEELFFESRQLGLTLRPENAQYLLVLFSGRGDLEACTYLFDMLRADGERTPSSLEYDSIIAVIIKGGDPLRALGLVREMCSRNHSPSYSLLHEVVNAFVQRGLLDDAQHLIEGLPRDNLDDFTTTCSNLITILAQRGELDRCERVCVLLEEAGGFPRTCAVNALMIAFGKVGMVDMAEGLFSMVLQQSPPFRAAASSYNALLSVRARNALFDQCGKLIGEMQQRQMPMELFAFRALVTSFAFRGRLDECESTYQHFGSAYRKLESVFEWLATPYARANETERLRAFARRTARSRQEELGFLARIDQVRKQMEQRAASMNKGRFPRL